MIFNDFGIVWLGWLSCNCVVQKYIFFVGFEKFDKFFFKLMVMIGWCCIGMKFDFVYIVKDNGVVGFCFFGIQECMGCGLFYMGLCNIFYGVEESKEWIVFKWMFFGYD